MRISALFMLSYLATGVAFSQAILGTVTDASSGQPIEYASVFFANTLKGTVTDADGKFSLPGIEGGKYDLTVSFVGYKTFTQAIVINRNEAQHLNIALQVEVMSLPEVFITADTTHWQNNFQVFKEHFLGTTPGSEMCSIQNPKVLYFYFDHQEKVLYAHAREPLKIRNNWLGYLLVYDMQSFKVDLKLGKLAFYGVPKFSYLEPKTRSTAKRWSRNRQLAYQGSLLHFFRSLNNARLQGEQYEVRELWRVPNLERPPSQILDMKISLFKKKIKETPGHTLSLSGNLSDSLRFYLDLKRQPEFIDSPGIKYNSGQELANNGKVNYKGILQVTFFGAKEHKNYPFRSGFGPSYQQSKLYLDDHLKIYDNGYFEDVRSMYVEGYWNWTGKIASILPLDYQP